MSDYDEFYNLYGPGRNAGMHNDLNSLFRLNERELKNQRKATLQEKNKAVMQAQKAYQEATPENKQAAQANLQNAQQAQQEAETEYTSRLSNTGKGLYKTGQAAKAAGKAFVSGLKQQLPGNKNSQSGSTQSQDNNTASGQSENNQEQTAEQKGASLGQKAANAVGTAVNAAGNALGSIANAKITKERVNDLNGPQKEEIRNTQMRGADAAKYRDAYMQKATVGTDSYTSKQASTDSKQKQETRQARTGAADADASLMVDDASSGDMYKAEEFKNENLANANKQSQEVYNARSAANKMLGKMQNEAYEQGQMADYNNQSNVLSNATGSQQETVQTEQQPAQASDNGQTAEEESTGAKDQSFNLPRDQVQHVFNAFLGSPRGADIIAGKGTPEEQAYFEYIKNTTGAVPSTTYDEHGTNWVKNENNKKAYNMLRDARAAAGTEGGGKGSDNFYRDENGNLINERTGQKASGYQNLQFTKEALRPF